MQQRNYPVFPHLSNQENLRYLWLNFRLYIFPSLSLHLYMLLRKYTVKAFNDRGFPFSFYILAKNSVMPYFVAISQTAIRKIPYLKLAAIALKQACRF